MSEAVVAAGDRVAAALEAVYAAAAVPALWPEALAAIAAVFDDVGGLIIYRRDDGSFGTVVSAGLEVSQRDYEGRRWWRDDVRMARSIDRGYAVNREAVTERHIVSEEEMRTLPFYADFLAGHGLRWFAGIMVSPDPTIAVALSLQRAAGRPPYTDAELDVVQRLGRHVENALRLSIRLVKAEATSLALGEALARLAIGVFLVDRAGRVVYANPFAEGLLDDDLLLAGGRLLARRNPERDALAAAITSGIAGGEKGFPDLPRAVALRSRAGLLAVHVLPLSRCPPGLGEWFLAETRAAVLAIPSRAEQPDPAVIRDLLGLTPGEARLASLVAGGAPPREAAGQLGITEETARSVLKRVFAKTGTSRQSELTGLITRLVLP